MTANNLAAVFAPCLFRCPYTDTTAFIQASEKEKRFLMKMIDSLDTANTTKITTVCIPEEEPSSLSSPPRSAPRLPQRIPLVSHHPTLASCPEDSRLSETEQSFPSPSTPCFLYFSRFTHYYLLIYKEDQLSQNQSHLPVPNLFFLSCFLTNFLRSQSSPVCPVSLFFP
jgi:hypothetical protein